jgi:hypothetical protein
MQTLFDRNDLHHYLQTQKGRVKAIINSVSEKDFGVMDFEEYQQHLINEYSISPLSLNKDAVEYEDCGETTLNRNDYFGPVDIVAFRLAVHIPYIGSKFLFNSIPPSRRLVRIEAEIKDNEITLAHTYTAQEKNDIRKKFDRDIDNIEFNLNSINQMVTGYNNEIKPIILLTIEERKKRLSLRSNIIDSLNLPMRRQKKEVIEYQIPTKRRNQPIRTEQKKLKKEKNYFLQDEEYQYTLNVLRNMTFMMERTPRVFQKSNEETIRDIFLVALNGHYEGGATGETFNSEGKTDILIRYEGRNAFIAECKFWDGAKLFIETIDQLTERYLTWRDTKAAIVIFNRNKDFTSIINQIPDLCRNHKFYVKDGNNSKEETEFHFIAKHKDDPERLINIAVMAFNISA